jgi:hypothetical protein
MKMLSFDPVPIGNNTYQLQEIVFNDTLKVAAINQQLNEKRISVFLSHALPNKEQPLNMTVQERYCLMLKYVENQSATLFSTDADFLNAICILKKTGRSEISQNGVTVRQLIGREASILKSIVPMLLNGSHACWHSKSVTAGMKLYQSCRTAV